MSNTPETDKVWRHPASFDGDEKVVHISVAQKLERERDQAIYLHKRMSQKLLHGNRELLDIRGMPETAISECYIKGEGNFVRSDICRKLERERDEARDTIFDVLKALGATVYEGSRLAALRVKSERDEAREERDHWKTEYEIVVARLCGLKHERDNGIVSENEIIPKLERDLNRVKAELIELRACYNELLGTEVAK